MFSTGVLAIPLIKMIATDGLAVNAGHLCAANEYMSNAGLNENQEPL